MPLQPLQVEEEQLPPAQYFVLHLPARSYVCSRGNVQHLCRAPAGGSLQREETQQASGQAMPGRARSHGRAV